MLSPRTRHFKLPIILAVLLSSTLACEGFEKTHCYWWEGGEWVNIARPYTDGCCKTTANDCSEYQLSPWDTPSPTRVLTAEPLTTKSGSPPEANPPQTKPSFSQTCGATQSLQVTGEIIVQETNQYGTRICEYTLTISNSDEDTGIWVYFYQHDKDGYAHTEKSRWMGNILIEPGEDGSWPASIYIYDDKDADGPLMSIPERIAGVSNIPECAEEKQDANFFELISVPIETVCPMD